MAMKINEVYNYLNYIGRKDPLGKSFSIPEFILNCQLVVFEYFKKIMGLPDQYQKGARDPVIGFGLNTISEEKIRPLKVLPTSIAVDSNGYANYPIDYFRKSSCYYLDGTTKINISFFNDSKFDERGASVIDPPSLSDPIANLQKEKICFEPKNMTPVYLRYIKYPTKPIMGYVTDIDTAEDVYVDNGAYLKILNPGFEGDTVTIFKDNAVQIGTYTVVASDTAEDVMKALVLVVNANSLIHSIKAVYDGEKIVFIDNIGTNQYLVRSFGGGITGIATDFSHWSTQFDWENDVESMNDIAEMLIDRMGISNRDVNLIQWAAKEEQK
jgi:hypothetical protein